MKYAAKPHLLNPNKIASQDDYDIWEMIEFSGDIESSLRAKGWYISDTPNFTTTFSNLRKAKVQKQADYVKYLKRDAAKGSILAEMASENMGRVRAGVWTVPQLISLTQDEQLKQILDDINTLSFELAYQKLMVATNPLLTSDVKNQWASKLINNFFNGG